MQIPAFDLTRQYSRIGSEVEAAMSKVVAGGHFILGENVSALEEEIARFCCVSHAIGVANGSDALHLALLALGVGPGDEVVVPTFTFFATGGAVSRVGATPVFADVDPVTMNLDPSSFSEAITERTKAVIPVHLYGNPADMDAIMEIAKRHGVRVIEDCAQAIGADYKGRMVGSIGDIATFSFFPTKNLGAFGDGGMVTTNRADLAERVRILRVHGARKKYHHTELGYNSRLDELQAAVLRVKLRYLTEWTTRRQALAAEYGRLLGHSGVSLPASTTGATHVYHQYTIRTADRGALMSGLLEAGIGCTVYYPVPLHHQPVFVDMGLRARTLPNAEAASAEALSLPMFPELELSEVHRVAEVVRKVCPRG